MTVIIMVRNALNIHLYTMYSGQLSPKTDHVIKYE